MVYDSNSFLSLSQMTVNAQYILDYLTGQNWDKNSICAMLGNMQTESTINPGIWQGLDSSNTSGGFGLVQWTPSTKYSDWATSNGLTVDNIDSELKRILYEVSNNIQWIPNGHQVRYGLSPAYDISFNDFVNNTQNYTVEELADAWLWNYEGAANPDQPDRQTQARYWFDNLTGGSNGGGSTPSQPTNQSEIITMLLSDTLNGWKW